jgi:hypothetical protein
MHLESADDDHAPIGFDPQAQRALITTVFDAAGRAGPCLLGAHAQSQSDKLSPQAPPQNLVLSQMS